MSLSSGEIGLADIAAVTGNNGRNNDNGWGGDGAWWIIILFLFVFCGWGNGGWGNNGNGNGGSNGPGFQGWATRSDIQEGFATNNIQNGITALQNGLCNSTYEITGAVNNGFAGVNQSLCQGFNSTQMGMMQGFNGVDRSICNVQQAISDCCCQTQNSIQNVRYDMATQACDTRNVIQTGIRDVVENSNANTRAVLDMLTQTRIQQLESDLSAAQTQLSQAQQTNNIVSALRTPTPIPAYTVPSPYTYTGCCTTC